MQDYPTEDFSAFMFKLQMHLHVIIFFTEVSIFKNTDLQRNFKINIISKIIKCKKMPVYRLANFSVLLLICN